MQTTTTNEEAVLSPPESALLKAHYKKSGLTVADLAAATGLSVGTISIALSGIRYRDGRPHVAVPPDRTIVRLSAVLHVDPEIWRNVGRARAADLLAEVTESGNAPTVAADMDAVAAVAGRAALARQVLSAFSSEELRSEISRREGE
ncbi:MAG TPA: helix-turn-helix transcriptional regulator [Plantibacter sp.]|uniref:helix-turn-helix domain-containing protein n=1 Tax=unclassified Plantibacter TaxID=2624265 RepID=UPI002CC21D0E|nr:helix-turn-helix transcriptional regulator [Plantibacter sp.]